MKLFALTLGILLLTQQQQQQPQTVRGRIEGTVLREATTEPVSGARVTVTRVNASTGAAVPTAGTIGTFLINGTPNVPLPPVPAPGPAAGAAAPPAPPPQPPPIPAVLTDRSGKFVVLDLEAGTYRVAVTLNGYVRQEYGQRAFTGQGTILTLTSGEVLKDLVVRMTRAGNVNGRLSDENGQPASGVPVQLLKVTYNAAGIKLFQQAGSARTNDRGEYRLYWITPGRYYLVAGTPPGIPPGGGPGGNPSPNETPDPYVFTFYPGTKDQARAIAVEVRPGSDSPMDFTVPRTQLFNISGRVVGAESVPNAPPGSTGPVAPAVNISLGFLRMEGGSGFIMMSQTYDSKTGNFMLRNIVPGSYALQANSGTSTARAAVEVVDSDVKEVVLALSGGINVTAKAQLVSGGPLPAAPIRLQLRPILKGVTHFVGFVPAAQVNPADGTLRMERILAGEYRATAAAPGHYVKELRFENSDALNSTIELSESNTRAPHFEIVLSPNVAQIDGVISDDRGQPLPGVQAVLIPDRYRDRADLFRSAMTDQSGKFNMRDIAPGDYKLFAWDGLDSFAYFEPEFIERYEQAGKPVRVEEGSKLVVDSKVIPQRQ